MKIAIYIADNCFGAGIHGVIDALVTANYVLKKSGADPLFQWNTVSLQGAPVVPTNGLTIQADYSLNDYLLQPVKPDIWVIPAVYHSVTKFEKIKLVLAESQPMIKVLKDHYEEQKLLVSICSGAFLLAEAGILHNRPALMHWRSEPVFRRLYPSHPVETQQSIVDYGNLICAVGGNVAYQYLAMHLIKRFAGQQVAINTAKLLMMDLNPPNASPYRDFSYQHYEHKDDLVRRAQNFIEQHSHQDINLTDMASTLGISDRQFKRRFNQTLNCSPLQYLQKIRISQACSLLEATQLPSSKIVYQIGYKDESSFRRLFKKQMDMTMETYRKQFGYHGAARP